MNKVDYNGMSFHYPTAKFSYVKMTIYYAIKARYTLPVFTGREHGCHFLTFFHGPCAPSLTFCVKRLSHACL